MTVGGIYKMTVGEYLIGLCEFNDDNKTITDQLITDTSNDVSFFISHIIDYLAMSANNNSNNGQDYGKDNDKTATTTTTQQ